MHQACAPDSFQDFMDEHVLLRSVALRSVAAFRDAVSDYVAVEASDAATDSGGVDLLVGDIVAVCSDCSHAARSLEAFSLAMFEFKINWASNEDNPRFVASFVLFEQSPDLRFERVPLFSR
mmetsp:Transcript_15448/g.42491  ORF Transcript_15448/g.42491 Transcript_15448/m.42491 type:complete len:121 (+) Transcript_15448:574-936(+)